jgi:uncharacterized membrane protein (DUF485 family)
MNPGFPEATPRPDDGRRARAANLRTALILASIALVFFVGFIVTQWLGGPTAGVGVMGAIVLAFLVFAIGRNLRR